MKKLDKNSLLWMAEGDLKTSEQKLQLVGGDERDWNIAGYHIQQALEKCIKFQLERDGIGYAHTHDLYRLCEKNDKIKNNIPIELRAEFSMITDWEAKSSYVKGYFTELQSIKKVTAMIRGYIDSEISKELARLEEVEKEEASLTEAVSIETDEIN